MVLENLADVEPLRLLVRLVGFALLSGSVAALVAFVYRTRFRSALPESAGLIVGLGAVAIYLNTRLVLVQFVGDATDPLTMGQAVRNVIIFGVAGVAAFGGRTTGHRLATSERFSWAGRTPSLSPIVRATGRFITVRLPESIEDIEGYDPVEPATKATLAGREFDFPRGLTVEELESELSGRLTRRYDIGYVDVELTAEGTVEFLAMGQRPAGLGETIPPGMAACAIRADPPFSAFPGDTIEIWRGGPEPEAVGMAEFRAAVGEVVTVVCERRIATGLDPEISYRLVTHAGDARPDRDFLAALRRSEETVRVLDLGPESPLIDATIASLDVTVIAMERADELVTIPKGSMTLVAGDRLFLIGRPERLRKLEERGGQAVEP